MNPKTTLVLLLLVGGLFTFIRIYESKQSGTKEALERRGQVFHFDRDDIDKIAIKNTENKIELIRDGNDWLLDEPVKDRADADVIAQLFTAAEGMRSQELTMEKQERRDKDQLKEYGLNDVTIKVKFIGKKGDVELEFGKEAAVAGRIYAKIGGTNTPLVVGRELKECVSKKADDFRERRLTDLTIPKVDHFSIKSSAGDLELERKDQHWSLRKPLRARGDDRQIGDLISQIATARIDAFVDKFTNLSAYGLQEPMGTVLFFEEGRKTPVVLKLGVEGGEEKDKNNIYGKLTDRNCVVLLPKSIAVLVKATPNDLRDKNLLRVDADIVDRITIASHADEKVVLARSGESWVRKVGAKEEAINVNAARRLLRDLQTQQVRAFVADVASDLPRYGLDQPALKVTLSSYASENTAETKAGDKPIVNVLFGKMEGDIVYARLEEEPFIVAVSQKLLETIAKNPVQWQPLEIYENRAEDITRLEVTREGTSGVDLVRDGNGTWNPDKGDATVNQINVQSLINTLATLRAVRWVGETVPEHRLDKPTVTISFKGANGIAGQIMVGAAGPDDVTYAVTTGKNGTFALSTPDLSAFQLALIERPAQAAPAASVGP